MSCTKSTNAKYIKRPGPPYPAQNCQNQRKKGNDGIYYVSKADKNGIFKWVKLKSVNKPVRKTSRKSRKTSRKTSRKSRKTSRKSRKTSRKSRKTSRKSRKASRKSRKTSRKSRKTSRKSRKVSRKTSRKSRKVSRKTSRKSRKASRKSRKVSRKSRKVSRKTSRKSRKTKKEMKKFAILAYYYTEPKPKNKRMVEYVHGQIEDDDDNYLLDAVLKTDKKTNIIPYLKSLGKIKHISEINEINM